MLIVCVGSFPNVQLIGVIRSMFRNLCIVQQGFKTPFQSLSDTCFLANNKSASNQPEFETEAVEKRLNGRYIPEQSESLRCVNPLSVAPTC